MRATYRGTEITATGHSLNEFTDTGHCMNEPAVSGHCLNDFTVSGKFIAMARQGNLTPVCSMLQERARITAELQQVKNKLLSCNHAPAVADYGLWCGERKKDFEAELKKLATRLETQKLELEIKLQQIDEQLAQHDVGSEEIVTGDFVSLIPKGHFDPVAALRSLIITANSGKSHMDISVVLDSYWVDRERPPGFLPESWTEKYGVKTFVQAYRHPDCRVLLHTLFSKTKAAKSRV